MDSKKICFIINAETDFIYNEMLQYINCLIIPAEFEVEYIRAYGENIAHSYNVAMKDSKAKYKIYLKSSTYVLEKSCIVEILDIFNDKTIGMVAAKGYDIIPLREDLWCTQKLFGKNIELMNDHMELNSGSEPIFEKMVDVQRVEGLFIATQYDIIWRDDVFEGNLFYDNAQSMEFLRAGYRAIVPCQEKPWCLYDAYEEDIENKKMQTLFFKEYENEIIKNSINRNYCYIEELKKMVFQELDLEEKLVLLNYLALVASGNIWGKYADPEIEKELYEISNKFIFKELDLPKIDNAVLHVMTEAYETGGHTRVVESWIKTDKEHKHFLIFTNPESIVPDWLRECVESSGGQILFVKGNSFFERSEDLFQQSMPFSIILLCIHNYDLIPILSYANSAWKKPIRFINHSDHLFWLGTGIVDLNLNITEFAEKISVERRKIENNILLYGPPQQKLQIINDEAVKSDIKQQLHIEPGQKVITSMASDWRYTNSKEADFPQFVLNVLEAIPNAIYIIIGAGPHLDKWKKLNRHNRVRFTGTIEKLKVSGIFSITDLYIDSFAHSSGGCLVDAFVYGLPVLALNCDRVDFLKSFSQGTVEKLQNATIKFLNGETFINDDSQQKYYDKYHGHGQWQKKLKEVYTYKANHDFHYLKKAIFKIDKYDIKVGAQFNPKMMGLLSLTYPVKGKYYQTIKKLIEEIYRIHLEEA